MQISKVSNISINSFVVELEKENPDVELIDKISSIQQHALRLIFCEIKSKIKVLAIRVTDINSNQEIAHLYATGIDGIFSLEFLCVKKNLRNTGIGSAVYTLAVQQALNWNMQEIKVCTYKFQAPEFYSKRGFIEKSNIPNALEGFSLDFFEKKISEEDRKVSPSNSEQLRFEVYTEDNFNLSDLYKEPKNEIRKIYESSISGLVDYNLKFLTNHDQIQRIYRQFAISSTDKKTGEIVFILAGHILTGNPKGSTMIPDTIGKVPEFVINQNGLDEIRNTILDTAKKEECTSIVPYDYKIEIVLEQLGFSSDGKLPLRKMQFKK
ncbi:MAG: GNAT family N-acetyltransferase [Parachlamydiaceae bacterium]|nr:GNAT family N-acetyltransferase [Parachlamydiaceae bacterium]